MLCVEILLRWKGRRCAIRNLKQRKYFPKFNKIYSCCSRYITTVNYKAVHRTIRLNYKCEKLKNKQVITFGLEVNVVIFR